MKHHWSSMKALSLGAVLTTGVLALSALSLFGNDAHGAAAAAGKAPPPGVYRFDRAAVVDALGQDRPVPAGTMFVPHGWQTTGGVVWGPQYACTDYLAIDWSASARDGRSSIAWLPQFRWEQNNTGNPAPLKVGCTQQKFTDARSYLAGVVQYRWPGGRVLDYRPRPDLASIKQPTSRPAAGGGQTTIHSDAGQVLFAYNKDGVDMRGLLVVSIDFDRTQLPTPGVGTLQFANAFAWPTFFATAPNGQLDLAYVETLRASYKADAAWLKVVSDHINKIRLIEIKGAGERAQIWHNTSEQIGKIITEGWRANQRTADQRAFEFGQMIRGVETYRDANGRGTELSSGYANAWKLNDGSYLLSTQVNFDPRRDLGLDGQKLEPQR